jgi:poly(A) polymerase
LYPNAAPNVVLARFFSIYSRWRWPTPVLLRELDGGANPQRVWNPQLNPKGTYLFFSECHFH